MSKAVLLTALLASACATRPAFHCEETRIELPEAPRIGMRVDNPPPACTHTIAGASQTWPNYATKVDGVEYSIGIDDDGDEKDLIRFISTTDPAFAPPEGLRIGASPAEALKAAPGQEIVLENGWGNYVRLPSGWMAFIDDSNPPEDLNLGTRPLGPNARVTMFFMRD
jgi:hypothetical protein